MSILIKKKFGESNNPSQKIINNISYRYEKVQINENIYRYFRIKQYHSNNLLPPTEVGKCSCDVINGISEEELDRDDSLYTEAALGNDTKGDLEPITRAEFYKVTRIPEKTESFKYTGRSKVLFDNPDCVDEDIEEALNNMDKVEPEFTPVSAKIKDP